MIISVNFLEQSRRRWVALVHAALARIVGVSLASVLVLDPCVSADEFVAPPLFEEWFMIHPIDVCAAGGIDKNQANATAASHYPDPLLAGIPVTMTAYSSTVDQTDEEPLITACGTTVRAGVIALSRDLLREYTPGAPFRYGERVFLDGYGEFVVEDTMHPRWTRRVDLWTESHIDARHFGRRRGRLHAVPNPQIQVARAGEALEAVAGEAPGSVVP